jgi:hypothetical protein
MFRVTAAEKVEVIAKCDHLRQLRFSRTLPFAFTEHGALMLASILNSAVATRASIEIVRVFIRLREAMASHRDLATKLDALERKCDRRFKAVFDAIRELMNPPRGPRRRIGFRTRRTR